jgi:hypothetical protein
MRAGHRSREEHADEANDRARPAAGKAALTDELPVQRKASGSAPPSLMMSPAPAAADAFDFGFAGVVQKKDKPADDDAADADAKPPEDDSAEALLIAYPDFKIDTESPLGEVGGLGHAGVLLINKKGLTRYYEYGRYKTADGTKGKVRKVSVSNVVIGADGKATPASLEKVLAELSAKSGKKGRIDAAYFQNVNFEVMEAYAQKKLKESNPEYKEYDKKRAPYTLTGNNCATFAEDVVTQDKDVDKPGIWVHSPVNTVSEYQDEGNAKVTYDPAAKAGSRLAIGEFDEADAKVKK